MPTKSGASSSSMYTTTSLNSSVLESSPSRHSPSRNGIRTPGRERALGSVERSIERHRNRRSTVDIDPFDSPELRRMTIEFSQMLSRNDQDFNDRLDQSIAEVTKSHNEQLGKAALEHERVRQCAERERQRLILEHEQLRIRQEEAQKREIERLQQEKAKAEAEAQQKQLEAKRKEEEAQRQAAERQRQIQEAESRLKAQKEQEEAARKQQLEKQEADRKAKEAAAVAAKTEVQAAQQPVQAPQTVQPAPAAQTSTPQVSSSSVPPPTSSDIENIHNRYLELHSRLKAFRRSFYEAHKKPGDPLKGPMGDARREITKRIGQVTTVREDSRHAIEFIREALSAAISVNGPTLDIRQFIISSPIPPLANEADSQVPALLVYCLCCFVKILLKQFDQEASKEDGRIIQELGLIGASLLADQKYAWKGILMTDILVAKYHKACPVLFGISGNAKTAQGLLRLGWKNGVDTNSFNQRQMGLGAGWAAITLRQFKAKAPAVPMAEYWRAVTSICNAPSNGLSSAHFMVLKGLLNDYAPLFIRFYGTSAINVLRRATIVLPTRAPEYATKEASLVKVLPDVFKKKYNLSLQ